MSYIFGFEAEFATSLRCIPMIVRYKLDLCGVKLKLSHWHQLSKQQRQWLVTAPCDSPQARRQYRQQLRDWVAQTTGKPPAIWPFPNPFPGSSLTKYRQPFNNN